MSTPSQAAPAHTAEATAARRSTARAWAIRPEHGALAAILTLSALLEFVRLSQNGFANNFYAAAVKSMLRSWSNFFFAASDPSGLITVDKPPLGLWVQALSAKVFGFAPLSLIVPEGVMAVLAVALLYRIVAPRFGVVAGLVSAFTLATFPSFVAVSRDNGVDPLLILLMLGACGAALAATDAGRLRWLIAAAVLVGLAFNTKSLAALLCVPGIVVAYLACAPGSLRRRLAQLLAAGVVLGAVAVSWAVAVDLTAASQRPYVGGSATNSVFQLDFGYNGFGRVAGQEGGPGGTTKAPLTRTLIAPLNRPGVDIPPTPAERAYFSAHPPTHRATTPAPTIPQGRQRRAGPIPFGGTRSPVRIFATGLGDQAGWVVPLAIIGLIAAALLLRRRNDRRTSGLIVLGGWMLVELATLDFSAGIVHPYYASALGPGLAAVTGAGSVAIASLLRGKSGRALTGYALAVIAIASTVAVQLVLIGREGYPTWWRIPLVVICLVAVAAIPFAARWATAAVAVAIGAVLVVPMIYSFSVWLAPVDGTFPAAGPYNYAGPGGYGIGPATLGADRALIAYLRTHGATKPYELLTQSSDLASPLILLGLAASAEGGYGAGDPALSGPQLAALVASGRARYVLIGGPYASRGGNGAETAAKLVCPEIPQIIWGPGTFTLGSTYLVDCKGLSRQLRHPLATARAFETRYHIRHYDLAKAIATAQTS